MNIQPPPSHSSPQVQSGTPVPPAAAASAGGGGGPAASSTTGSALAQVPQAAPQTYVDTAVRDSHPIASEELVERLEEISTQQGSPDATGDDPER